MSRAPQGTQALHMGLIPVQVVGKAQVRRPEAQGDVEIW